jgi:hypothetical protein
LYTWSFCGGSYFGSYPRLSKNSCLSIINVVARMKKIHRSENAS